MSALVVGGAVVALGVRVWSSGICFALCGFVSGTITQEYIRGARVRQTMSGTALLTAMIGLIGRNKRRYGGYIVHLGIVLIFLGFAGGGLSQDEQVLLKPGEQVKVGDYVLRLDALRVTDDGQKQMITGHIAVSDQAGKDLGKMHPARWFFRKHEESPTSEVAIRRTFAEDLYLVMPGYDIAEQSVSLEVHVNPLVNWVWRGFGVLAIGSGIARLPESVFAFAVANVPAGAATASIVLLSVLLSPLTLLAQPRTVEPKQRPALQRQLEDEIMCTCPCHQIMGGCQMRPNCAHYDEQSARLASYIAEGKDRDAIRAAFVQVYGGEAVLGAPIDRGFNRLAWFVPYFAGVVGLILAGISLIRWSRRPSLAAAAGAPSPDDGSLAARLDDELRDLD
jgi:cytochrome c-type biogenesis protein CcmF